MANKKENEKEQLQEQIDEMEAQIKKMNEDRYNKLSSAKSQLVENLNITADKYRTATGTIEALNVFRNVIGDSGFTGMDDEEYRADREIGIASLLAEEMACDINMLAGTASGTGFDQMNKICDTFYEQDYKYRSEEGDGTIPEHLTKELMRLDICRNIGPAAEDITAFAERSREEINEVQVKLAELKAKANK